MPVHLTVNDTAEFVTASELGAVNGVATLGSDGKVPNSQLPTVLTGSVDSVNGQVGNVTLNAADVGAVDTGTLGAVNGTAQLDSTQHLVAAQLPTTALTTAMKGVANGVATLDGTGHLTAGQLNAPVTSVNTLTGAVVLTAASVSAVATSARGVANGVASLDTNTLVPIAQIPSLAGVYQQIPTATPTASGQVLSSISSGSNSTQWSRPMVYTASSLGAMPTTNIPTGAICTRTDTPQGAYVWTGSAWVLLPYTETWRTLPLTTGWRGYNNNDPQWLPQIRRVGAHVFIRGRVELTAGGNVTAAQGGAGFCTLPSDCIPANHSMDLTGTCTVGTAGGAASTQNGTARYQLNESGTTFFIFFNGTTVPISPWYGFNFDYWVD
jgi:hypothetical protein